MKITHNKVGQNLNLTDTSALDKAGKTGKAGKANSAEKVRDPRAGAGARTGLLESSDSATSVNLSNRAQDMKKIKESAMAVPDIDEAKVARLQKLIDDGKYSVSAEDIADKMVDTQLAFS